MKMRVLTTGKSKKVQQLADAVRLAFASEYRVDTIYQPAYACEKERLVVIAGPIKSHMPEIFSRTLRSYNKSITSNVAFMVAGTPEKSAAALEKYKAIIAEAGSHVIDDVFYFNVPFLGGKMSPEEKAAAEEWVKTITAQMV